jgi:hypothetical protein
MIFLAPLLALAAWCRGTNCTTPVPRTILFALTAWFAAVACLEFYYVLHPIHPANRDGFIAQMLACKWLYMPEVGPNVPACLGLLACATVMAVWAWPGRTRVWLGGFFLAAVTLAAGAVVIPAWRAPVMQFYARDQTGFLSIPLALIALWLWRHPRRWRTAAVVPASAVLLLLALATAAVQAATTADWDHYVTAVRGVLRDDTGVVSWDAMMRTLPPDEATLFARLNWGWTYPDLSLLLADQGEARAIIANPPGQPWQPWNPAVRTGYPTSAYWHFPSVLTGPDVSR